MCAPSCCPSPATVAGRSGAGGVVVLALVVVAGVVFAALFGWPTVLLCLVAAVVTTGAALWGIAVLAYRVNRALYGPDLATVSPAQPEGPVRVRATATDLPDPERGATPRTVTPRVLTAAEVEAMTAHRSRTSRRPTLPPSGTRRGDTAPPGRSGIPVRRAIRSPRVVPMVAAWPLCLPSDGPWPWLAMLGLAGAAWLLGRLDHALTDRRPTRTRARHGARRTELAAVAGRSPHAASGSPRVGDAR